MFSTRLTFDCPHCNDHISVVVNDSAYEDNPEVICPHCDKVISDDEVSEQMDRYEDPSEHFDDFSDADPGL